MRGRQCVGQTPPANVLLMCLTGVKSGKPGLSDAGPDATQAAVHLVFWPTHGTGWDLPEELASLNDRLTGDLQCSGRLLESVAMNASSAEHLPVRDSGPVPEVLQPKVTEGTAHGCRSSWARQDLPQVCPTCVIGCVAEALPHICRGCTCCVVQQVSQASPRLGVWPARANCPLQVLNSS